MGEQIHMDQKWLFPLTCAANLALLSVCLLYRGGTPLIMVLMPPLHILLFLLNMRASKRWWHVIVLGVLHIAVTFCVLQQSSWLYFRYIVDDVEGRAIAWLECVIGVGLTTVLLIVSLVWFAMKQRKIRTGD